MNHTSKYANYFSTHYKMSYSSNDIAVYRRWFVSQWDYIQKRIFLKRRYSVLEIGAGLGSFYSFLPDDMRYVGLELDSSAVSFANSHFKKAILKCTPIEKYTPKDSYDVVFAFEVLEHLDNPIDAIKHIHSLLKKNGIFVGTSPYPYPKNVWGDATHKYVLHPENWKKLFEEAGFRSVSLTPMTYAPFIWKIHPKLNIRIPFYVRHPWFVSTCLIIAKA